LREGWSAPRSSWPGLPAQALTERGGGRGRCPCVMAGPGPANHDFAPSNTASRGWPAQACPWRATGLARGTGHDTAATGPALSAFLRTSRAMTGRCGRCVSTKLRLAVILARMGCNPGGRSFQARCSSSASPTRPAAGVRSFDEREIHVRHPAPLDRLKPSLRVSPSRRTLHRRLVRTDSSSFGIQVSPVVLREAVCQKPR
jgi:hypothetical protein